MPKKKSVFKTKGPPIQEDRQMKGKQQKQIPKFAASAGETPKDQQRPSLKQKPKILNSNSNWFTTSHILGLRQIYNWSPIG